MKLGWKSCAEGGTVGEGMRVEFIKTFFAGRLSCLADPQPCLQYAASARCYCSHINFFYCSSLGANLLGCLTQRVSSTASSPLGLFGTVMSSITLYTRKLMSHMGEKNRKNVKDVLEEVVEKVLDW